jgi:hypothetical protein
LLQRHIGAHETLGSLCFRVDGLVRWLCIDIDVCRAALMVNGDPQPDALLACHADAMALAEALRALGAYPLVEDSGQKGRHVWVRFDRPVPAKMALRLAFAAEDAVGDPPEQVRRELFPDREVLGYGKDGPLVKLPWGLHGKSGRRCLLLDLEGNVASDQLQLLMDWAVTPLSLLEALPLAGARQPLAGQRADPAPEGPAKVQLHELSLASRVFQSCAVLGHVAAKAEATRYLDHRERLLVLMSLGHLGPEGPAAIHAVMATTSNYHPQTTDKYIKSLAPSPISCGRIRERYPDLTRQVACDCAFRLSQGAYPTPLLHAMKPSQVGALRGHAGDAHDVGQRPAPRPAPAAVAREVSASARVQELPRTAPVAPPALTTAPTPAPPPAPSAPPPRAAPEAMADPALATLHRWLRLHKEIAMLDKALALHFRDGDRLPCALGTLVRERKGDRWVYRVDIGLAGEELDEP